VAGGFFSDATAPNGLTPTQNLFIVSAIVAFDGASRR